MRAPTNGQSENQPARGIGAVCRPSLIPPRFGPASRLKPRRLSRAANCIIRSGQGTKSNATPIHQSGLMMSASSNTSNNIPGMMPPHAKMLRTVRRQLGSRASGCRKAISPKACPDRRIRRHHWPKRVMSASCKVISESMRRSRQPFLRNRMRVPYPLPQSCPDCRNRLGGTLQRETARHRHSPATHRPANSIRLRKGRYKWIAQGNVPVGARRPAPDQVRP